ncbi:MAG: hypothetical protein GKS03_14515 [Alphaproteobacteria bacterium]|nr:hypothetical protein [Alphaproteobacteria bacterium]
MRSLRCCARGGRVESSLSLFTEMFVHE